MLNTVNPFMIEQALRDTPTASPLPPAHDREAWQQPRELLGEPWVRDAIRGAEEAAAEKILPLPATLFLDFKRRGERYPSQKPQDQRRMNLRSLVLGECLEGEGRFLDSLLDVAWTICEESSWARPAHQIELTDMTQPVVDLYAATTALELAELDLVLGELLDPALGKRIRYEVDRRCFTPYLTRHDHHWMFNTGSRHVNNWAGVCNAGVVGAALHLEPDPSRLAAIISKALRSLQDYLDGFDPDGGTSEGSYCWTYGFGYYTILAQLLEHYTGGAVSLWNERSKEIALFPLRTYLSPKRFVSFSDCHLTFTHIPPHLNYLGQRLNIPSLSVLARQLPPNRAETRLPWVLRECFWLEPAFTSDLVEEMFVPAAHDWFRDLMWMVSRRDPDNPDGLVLAVKGGHNAEMHNQNDVGTFMFHWHGESLVTDPGKGHISRAYFDHVGGRYEIFVNTSRGHSVPLVNGQMQAYGRSFQAEVLEHASSARVDKLVLDLTKAYPDHADLASLKRTVALHRDTPFGWVELTDEVTFSSGLGRFESVLITLAEVVIEGETVTILGEKGALQVCFDSLEVVADIETVERVALENEPISDVKRVTFRFPEARQTGTIKLRLEPHFLEAD